MLLKDICNSLESWAPLSYQESYDNSGLIIGNKSTEISAALVSLDCTEEVVDEAISLGCNLIISHHPIIFNGVTNLTGKTYVERTILKAIKNDIALYAIHTNLDNIVTGVNAKISQKIGLVNTRILQPKSAYMKQLIFYVPAESQETVTNAMYDAGAGAIGNYSECSFSVSGVGSFKGLELSNPKIGEKGVRTTLNEQMVALIYPSHKESSILSAMKNAHPYEEVAYHVFTIDNQNQHIGSGMIGDLLEEVSSVEFLKLLKNKMNAACVRHTKFVSDKIKKVALCGGSGSFLLDSAKRSGADVFVTSDFKYHDFFNAENKILIADIGHYESEQYTIELISDFLRKKFPSFAVRLTKVNTNPINYL